MLAASLVELLLRTSCMPVGNLLKLCSTLLKGGVWWLYARSTWEVREVAG